MQLFLTILKSAASIYVALCVLLYFLQSKMMYFPSHMDTPSRLGFEKWFGPDGEFLGYIRHAVAAKKLLVFFHGNGGEAIDREWIADIVENSHTTIVLCEYPGYGNRGGKPSEEAFIQSARKQLDILRDSFELPMTLVGESLGSGVAIAVADHPGVVKLGLISPFDSTLAIGKRHYPFLPLTLLMRDTFRSDKRIGRLKIPIHIVHGAKDEIIPLSNAEKLYSLIDEDEKAMTVVLEANHNDMYIHLDRSPQTSDFVAFLNDL